MAILNIVQEGDEVLRKKSREVTEITPKIMTLIADMIETLHRAQGAGLAAPQVGVLKRICIVEAETGKTIVLINPRIVAYSGEQQEIEGCLSVPGKWGITKRPMCVTVKALNIEGEEVAYTASGFEAKAFCHEIDHLDGILYTDKAVRMLTNKEIEEMQ